jgi:hypothetical protein
MTEGGRRSDNKTNGNGYNNRLSAGGGFSYTNSLKIIVKTKRDLAAVAALFELDRRKQRVEMIEVKSFGSPVETPGF